VSSRCGNGGSPWCWILWLEFHFRKPWKIEAVFGELKAALNSEVETLEYPKAALFAFCTSLLASASANNVISTLKQVI